MRIFQMHRHPLIGLLLILLATAGCFQAVGGDLSATDVAQAAPTFTLIPSETPIPTDPPTETPMPEPTDEPELPEQTETFTGGASESAMLLLSPQAIAQEPTIDPLLLTVTAIYAGEEVQEQPQQQDPVVIATNTPEPEVLDPIAMTATHIVERATQTAAAPLTAIALTQNPVLPTATEAAPVDQQPGATLVPGADCIHEVRATDRNLYRIALNYGLTIQQIANASGIVNPDLIYVGQKLTIPGCGVTGARPLPTSTPRPGVTPGTGNTGAVPAMTFTPIPDGQALPPSGSVGGSHTVMQGETLFQISLQYGTTVHAIAAANGISNINLIYIGQQLVIP